MRRALLVLLLTLGYLDQAAAQTYTVAPPPYQTVLNNSGDKVSNACVWTYVAGTSTPVATYSDALGTVNTNPIRTDSAGRFTAYLVPGTGYKFVYELPCTPPGHGTTLRTADNITGTPTSSGNVDTAGVAGQALNTGDVVFLSDGVGALIAGQWYLASAVLYYSSVPPPIGIVTGPIASGATGPIRLYGLVTGLSGLAAGSTYYVGTGGALTVTAPSPNVRVVGVAQSATSLILSANPSPATIGVWTSVPYSAANFTASTGTWTVDASDVGSYLYLVIGKSMWLSFHITATSVSATPNELLLAIPGGYAAAIPSLFEPAVSLFDGGTWGSGFASVEGTKIGLYKSLAAGSTWATSTNATHVSGTVYIPLN